MVVPDCEHFTVGFPVAGKLNDWQVLPSVLWCCWLGGRKGIQPVKTEWCGAGIFICLERGADLHTAQLMPLTLTVSCFSKIQIGFTFLVPAHLGSPGQRAVKRVCCIVWQGIVVWNDRDYRGTQTWSVTCDRLLSRCVDDGTVFELRRADVSLLVTVRALPHFNLVEDVLSGKGGKFVLRMNSETSVWRPTAIVSTLTASSTNQPYIRLVVIRTAALSGIFMPPPPILGVKCLTCPSICVCVRVPPDSFSDWLHVEF